MRIQKTLHLHDELEKARPKCHGHLYAIFEKYDGWYGYADFDGGEICSRAGRTIPSMEWLSKTLEETVQAAGRLIFEIMIPNIEFSELNGVLNRKHEQAYNAYLMCHDWIPYAQEDMPFRTRYLELEKLVGSLGLSSVRLAPIRDISHKEAVWRQHAQNVWSEGGEGVVLKRIEAPYGAAVRNYDMMKIKEELDLDLLVVGMEEGLGKYKETLGALHVIDSNGTDHTISGMSDSERDLWWNDRSLIEGKVVQVKAMKRLPDGQLREPRFVAIRYDKTSDEID